MDEHKSRQPDKVVKEYSNWLAVSQHNGWLVYEQYLKRMIEEYSVYMDNVQASGDLLKNYQLIKKGLMLALNIPKMMELKARTVKKNEQKKRPSRIENFFRVGK